MRSLPLPAVVFALLVLCTSSAVAQLSRPVKAHPRSRHQQRITRFELGAHVGLMPTFLTGGRQEAPVVQAALLYTLTSRLAVGVAYGASVSTSEGYVDREGVVTTRRSAVRHAGVRMRGEILRRGPWHLYGGIQLGVNAHDAVDRHRFPEDFAAGDPVAYLAERASPFAPARTQLAVIGFFGGSVEVLPKLTAGVEIGNNLSLASAGLGLKF